MVETITLFQQHVRFQNPPNLREQIQNLPVQDSRTFFGKDLFQSFFVLLLFLSCMLQLQQPPVRGRGYKVLWQARNPLAASQWHLWGLVFGLNVEIWPGFLFLFHQWLPASGICRVQNPKPPKNQRLSLFQLYKNGRRPVGRALYISRRGRRDHSCFCLFGTPAQGNSQKKTKDDHEKSSGKSHKNGKDCVWVAGCDPPPVKYI